MNKVLDALIAKAGASREVQRGRLSQAQALAEGAKARLDSLQAYRQECMVRAQGPGATWDAAGLYRTHAFLARLDDALAMQHREVGMQLAGVERERLALLGTERRLLALRALQARRAQEARALAQRLDQRVNDEFGARAMRTQQAWS